MIPPSRTCPLKNVLALWSIRNGLEEKNKLARLIRKSELYFSNACIEDIEYYSDRNLIELRLHVYQSAIIFKKTTTLSFLVYPGLDMTYMSYAFRIAAYRNFYTVKYIRLPDLLNEFTVPEVKVSSRWL